MARVERGTKKPCCMVSEMLEEMGLDRQKARQLRRQILEGLILLCQWQLQRMAESPAPSGTSARKARKLTIE